MEIDKENRNYYNCTATTVENLGIWQGIAEIGKQETKLEIEED